MNDPVHNPKHYEVTPGLESIEIIRRTLTPEQFEGFCLGNILKYRLRAGKKDDIQQEIDKADTYAAMLHQAPPAVIAEDPLAEVTISDTPPPVEPLTKAAESIVNFCAKYTTSPLCSEEEFCDRYQTTVWPYSSRFQNEEQDDNAVQELVSARIEAALESCYGPGQACKVCVARNICPGRVG